MSSLTVNPRQRGQAQPSPPAECPICFDKLSDVQALSTALPCGHKYCTSCLQQWLRQPNVRRTRSCPVCRGRIREVVRSNPQVPSSDAPVAARAERQRKRQAAAAEELGPAPVVVDPFGVLQSDRRRGLVVPRRRDTPVPRIRDAINPHMNMDVDMASDLDEDSDDETDDDSDDDMNSDVSSMISDTSLSSFADTSDDSDSSEDSDSETDSSDDDESDDDTESAVSDTDSDISDFSDTSDVSDISVPSPPRRRMVGRILPRAPASRRIRVRRPVNRRR